MRYSPPEFAARIDDAPCLDRVLANARAAQARWSSRPLADRLAVLRRFRHRLADHAEELAGSVRRPTAETLTAQIIPLADHARFLERNTRRVLQPRRLGASGRPSWLLGVRSRIVHEPVGVVLIIAPSNYPLFIPGTQLLHAIAAGNAVLLKPAPEGRIAAITLARLLSEAGLPDGLLSVLPHDSATAVDAVEAGPDLILLTGSSETGRKVLTAAAARLTPCILELSGSDAVFVRADANLNLVCASLIFGLTLNQGATCIAPRRVFVPTGILPLLEQKLVSSLEAVPPVPISPQQSARIRTLLADALVDGAKQLHPSGLDDVPATGPIILTRVTPSMELPNADVFAPVLSLIPVEDDEAALRASRQCPFALAASVFTSDGAAGQNLARHIHAGSVSINDLILPTADPRVPFGGRGESGYGVTRGEEGLRQMTRIKVISTRHGGWRPHLGPSRPQDSEFFAAALRASHGGNSGHRFVASIRTLWLALRRLRRQ